MTPDERARWLEQRRSGLGGTDVPRILGLAPPGWGGEFAVWAEKTGQSGGIDETEAMRWGRLLEPVVAEEWARREDFTVQPAPFVRSAEQWLCGSPDFIVHDGDATVGVLEVKTSSAWM
ncbi:MAG: YqaJ viral recombinase family protein, partial [Verrucomicrobiota bacterium]